MKAILISIKPKYVANILNGKKTLEIRKAAPKCKLPIDVYIYCTLTKNNGIFLYDMKHDKPILRNGKVVAKFTLNKAEEYKPRTGMLFTYSFGLDKSCLTYSEIDAYGYKEGKGYQTLYAWHIDNLEIFDRPKELNSFVSKIIVNKEEGITTKLYMQKAPQSWQFIEV